MHIEFGLQFCTGRRRSLVLNLLRKKYDLFVRTKLKQTEADCEILKRCCESLTGENQRLRLELAQMQGSEAGLYLQSSFPPLAAAMASVCPSCDKVITVASGGETSGRSSTSYSS
jgi:homeobox-leucine zipper protein